MAKNVSGRILNFKGEKKCDVCYGDQQVITKCLGPDLTGLDWSDELKLLKRMKKFTQTAQRKALNKSNHKNPKKKRQHSELNPAVGTVKKPELIVNYFNQTENGDLPLQLKLMKHAV
ncbi:hypothetical protein ACTXT7_014373 [Hymenolepis weldensis]